MERIDNQTYAIQNATLVVISRGVATFEVYRGDKLESCEPALMDVPVNAIADWRAGTGIVVEIINNSLETLEILEFVGFSN